MTHWTLGEFLFWLLIAILVPALIVHFTLGRNGGHHLFDKDGLSPKEIRDLPFKMFRRREERKFKSSLALLIGLVAAMVVYPLGCIVGIPINVFGISDQTLFYMIAGGVAVAILFATARNRA